MPQNRRSPADDPVIDDYPVPPAHAVKQDNLLSPKKGKGENRTLVLLSITYFLYGCGLSIYGPLYPELARKEGLNTYIYGSVLATSHLMCILFYPVAVRIVTAVSLRNSLSVGIFVVGACRILFGTVCLISSMTSFVAICFAIQAVEGIGMAILIASTITSVCGLVKGEVWKAYTVTEASACLGLFFGPIAGKILREEMGFEFPFYVFGGLTALNFLCIATLLPKPGQQISYGDMPIIYWMKDKKMIIYFVITFASFNYVGFLSVSLELILKQFHLNSLNTGLIFAIAPFAYGLTFPSWTWIIRHGCNNVMSIFIGSIFIFASLVLLGPAPFTTLEGSLTYVCWALALQGLGTACKCACVVDASEQDLSYEKKYTEIQQKLVCHTVFILGAFLGYFSGSLAAGIKDYYIGYKKATLPLFALEICIVILAVLFAFNRNYIARRQRRNFDEREPILNS